MKRFLMSFFLLFTILGCREEPVKTTTSKEKIALVKRVISGDQNAIEELDQIKEKLKKQMDNGQVDAKVELEEWWETVEAEEWRNIQTKPTFKKN